METKFVSRSTIVACVMAQFISVNLRAQNTPSGTLSVAPSMLKISDLGVASKYSTFLDTISKVIVNGNTSMKVIEEFKTGEMDELNEALDLAVENAIDPNHEYAGIYELLDVHEWAQVLFNYAAGDEIDKDPTFRVVNRALRDQRPNSKIVLDWIKKMRISLGKLPKFDGVTFRGTRLTEERIEEDYRVSRLARDAAFISTSVSAHVAYRYAEAARDQDGKNIQDGKVAAIMIIQGFTGRPISTFAFTHSREQEILFANGTPMMVVSKSPVFDDVNLGKTQIIVLREIEK